MSLEAWEEREIIRYRLAKTFGVTPLEIDEMSYQDICMSLAIMGADAKIEEMNRTQ